MAASNDRAAIRSEFAAADASISADLATAVATFDAQFAAMVSVQELAASGAYDGSAVVFIDGPGTVLTIGAVGSAGEVIKVKSKVANGDVQIDGDIEGTVANSVTLSDNGAVMLVSDGSMWWIM